MPDERLTFLSWVRERIAGLATTVEDGRPRARTTLTLSGTDATGAPTTTATRDLDFLLAGPADVVGVERRAVTARYPTPGTIDHESDRCAHVEFADPGLPWRYTPAPKPPAGSGTLHPWLVLVVGVEGDEVVLAGDQTALSPAVQTLHPIGAASSAHRWAHVQVDDAGRRVARLLSGRPLDPGTDYLAVLVPAFDAAGQPRWTGGGTVTVPVYDHWRFRTATPAGSFEDLAARLQPGAAPPTTGRAPLDYPRVPAADDLEVRGALAPIGASDAALDPAVRADLDGLRTPATDPQGRPIVGLPRYGDAWDVDAPDTTTWGQTLNTDPRDRGTAGLGLELAIRLQDDLAAEATAHVGALAEARQRIAALVLGIGATRGLWTRRIPKDPLERLWLLGPALRRVVTPDGPVAELATAPGRALPAGIFSTAARRALRPGPVRTSGLDGPVSPGAAIVASNRCPDPPERTADGVAIDVDPDELDAARAEALASGQVDLDALIEGAALLADQAHPSLQDFAFRLLDRMREARDQGVPAPWLEALALLVAAADPKLGDEDVERLAAEFRRFLERFPEPATEEDLPDILDDLDEPEPVEPPCSPVDLDVLVDGVTAAFDPTGDEASAIVRVLETIDGWDPAQPLAPPEVCIGLDRPVWSDVADAFPEWLLPGVGAVPEDAVIAVETNPRFVDDLLTGINTQLLGELRWRNIPVATGCTPLRVFWDRADTGSGTRVDDIIGLHAWDDTSDVGASQHRPAGASGRDLVVLIRGHLFLRYPATVVYLTSAVHGADPDFDQDPLDLDDRVLPSFQGRIADDVTFFGFQGFDPGDVTSHWLVFEEPPAGYRFANDVSSAPQAHTWAEEAFAHPVRVLIRGDALDPEG